MKQGSVKTYASEDENPYFIFFRIRNCIFLKPINCFVWEIEWIINVPVVAARLSVSSFKLQVPQQQQAASKQTERVSNVPNKVIFDEKLIGFRCLSWIESNFSRWNYYLKVDNIPYFSVFDLFCLIRNNESVQ